MASSLLSPSLRPRSTSGASGSAAGSAKMTTAGSTTGSASGSAVSPPPLNAGGDRPSFSAFWKRTRTAASAAVQQIASVPSSGGGRRGRRAIAKDSSSSSSKTEDTNPRDGVVNASDASAAADASGPSADVPATTTAPADATVTTATPGQPLSAQEKARIRRAQVRRAQIQHRQRKAEYQEHLEIDIDTLRWLIDAGSEDVKRLQAENDALREELGKKGDPATAATAANTIPETDETAETVSLFGDIDLDEVLVSMAVDEVLGVPMLRVESSSCEDSSSPQKAELPVANTDMAPELALARPDPSAALDLGALDLNWNLDQTLDLGIDQSNLLTDVSRTHGLVPTPPPVPVSAFPVLTAVQKDQVINLILALEHVCWGHVGHQFQMPTPGSFCADTGHILMASSLVLREAPDQVYTWMNAGEGAEQGGAGVYAAPAAALDAPADSGSAAAAAAAAPASPAWQATGVSLESLYGLAVALNGQSDTELAPVQAWFELMARFPVAVLLREDVLASLRRELLGVVTCLYFGAVMERRAFESVVEQVVWPAIWPVAEQVQ